MLSIEGRPEARYALVASRHEGLTSTRAGTWCIDLSRRYFVLRDSLRGADPPLDLLGRASYELSIPGSGGLLAARANFQAVVRDPSARGGFVLSRLESRVIGNGSVGNFTQASFDLPNSDLMRARKCARFFDADGDGDLDLIIGNGIGSLGGGRTRLFINDGAGVFTDGTFAVTTGLPDQEVVVARIEAGDVDGDGDLDLYLANACCIDATRNGQDRLYLNDGNGFFVDVTFGVEAGVPHDSPEDPNGVTFDVDLADLDGDGDLDVFLAENGYGGMGRIFINSNGRGLFVDGSNGPDTFFPRYWGDGQVRAGAVGDIDGDGDLDIVMTGFLVHRLYVNQGGGVFVDGTDGPVTGLPNLTGILGADVQFADLDGDGDLDIVIAADISSQGGFHFTRDRILFNDGRGRFRDGTFGPGTGLPAIEDVSRAVLVGDVDRDGDMDLIFLVTSYAAGHVTRLYLNDGRELFVDSTFGPQARLPGLVEEALGGALGDVDGDGDLDLVMLRNVVPNGSLPVTIYYNR